MPHDWRLQGAKNPYQTSQYWCPKCQHRANSFGPPDPEKTVLISEAPTRAFKQVTCEEAVIQHVHEE